MQIFNFLRKSNIRELKDNLGARNQSIKTSQLKKRLFFIDIFYHYTKNTSNYFLHISAKI